MISQGQYHFYLLTAILKINCSVGPEVPEGAEAACYLIGQ